MKRQRVNQVLALALSLFAYQASQAEDEVPPIVDIRFDASYRQIASSLGDEWAPTWGRDDVLYTGNDDGNSFGGIAENNIAFGKLEGNDPNRLTSISVSAMDDFREPPQLGPEGAQWNSVESEKIGSALYRLAPCGELLGPSGSTCLLSSGDDGKTWTGRAPVGKPLFRQSIFQTPHLIVYSKTMEAGLGAKPGEYVYAASYADRSGGQDRYLVGRVRADRLAKANPSDWSFLSADYSWGPFPSAAPIANSSGLGPDGANWKTMNTYSVDGALYMFVTRCFYPSGSSDPQHRHIFQNSSVIKSTDNGQAWIRSREENYAHPMFPGKRFGTPYFVWYGKDGAAVVDNADQYVYAVSNNGHFENGDDYILGRVLRSRLPQLRAADWSFYTVGDGMQPGSWTPKLDDARPILSHPRKSSMTGMTYIEGLGRYVMVVWHYHRANFEQGIKDHDLGTVLEFFEAPKPWGPWTQVKSFDTGKLGWYTPIIGQRFQTSVGTGAVKAFLYATGFLTKPEGGLDMSLYKLNYMPITLSTKPLPANDPGFAGGR